MKRIILLISFLSILFSSPIANFSSLRAQDLFDEDQQSDYFHQFTISRTTYGFYYSPGDTVRILFHPNRYNAGPNYEIHIYRISDPEKFYSDQKTYYSPDPIGKDSINLMYLCEEVLSHTKPVRILTEKVKKDSVRSVLAIDTTVFTTSRPGIYLVKVRCNKKMAFLGFAYSNLAIISETANNSILCFTTTRIKGEPVDSVILGLYSGTEKIARAETRGALFYRSFSADEKEIATRKSAGMPMIIATKGDDVAISDPSLYFNFNRSTFTGYIYPEQPIFRPPSKAGFKGIFRMHNETGYVNCPGIDVYVTVTDPKNSQIYKKTLKTNEFGTFSDSVELDYDAAIGDYTIKGTIETAELRNELKQDTTREEEKVLTSPFSFSGSFSVEEFRKPEFKVELKTDKEQYSDGETISADISSDYYFGSPVQDADVEYLVFKKPMYRPWWFFSEYRWLYESYYTRFGNEQVLSNLKLIYTGTGKLDKNGKLNVKYKISESFKEKYQDRSRYSGTKDYYETDYTYVIQAGVTDKSRRKIGSTKTVNVTRTDFYLSSHTDKYLYKPGEKIGIEVRTANFSDKGVAEKFTVSAYRITYEGKYSNRKKITNFVSTSTGRTVSTGAGTAFIDAAGEGYYEIEVAAFDSKGKKILRNQSCLVSSGDMYWWSHEPGTVEIITDKESYVPGDTCHALIIAAHDTANILVTSENGNILSYSLNRSESSSKYVDIPITDNFAPNFNIVVRYIGEGQYFTNQQHVLVIPTNSFLNLDISANKPVYKPREEGVVTVTIKDRLGNPVKNAEVSIGMIDESLYAIKEDLSGDIKSAFYSPTEFYFYGNNSNNFNLPPAGISRLPNLFDRFDYKSIKPEKLSKIRGRIIDIKREAVSGALIMLDDYVAGSTEKDGTFEFSVPEGSYSPKVFLYNYQYPGEFQIDPAGGRTYYLEIRGDFAGILTAYWIDENGIYLPVKNGRKDERITEVTDSIDVIVQRRNIPTETSGKIISSEFIDNTGIRGIENITAKTNGVVEDKKKESEQFVEAETRTDFRDAMLWMPSVVTDENGEAKVSIKFPDNLTTWRITAKVITEDTKVGQTKNSVICRKDLIVRMETPRFFQEKDEVYVSTILHNYLSEDKKTKISFKLNNLAFDSVVNPEQFITLGKNEERRIDWKIKVTDPTGTGKIYASALTNEESDAVEVSVPLQPYGVRISNYQSFDIAGVNGVTEKSFELPEETDLRSANIRIGLSPSIASSVLGSLEALLGYPYGCIEQTMSRFIPTIVVATVLKETGIEQTEFYAKQMPKMVKSAFSKIKAMQHNDGGWGWWSYGNSNAFMSAYVINGLTLANKSGYAIDKDEYKKGITYLLNNIKTKAVNNTTRAYMIYVLSQTDSVKTDKIKVMLSGIEGAKLSDFDKALLSLACAKTGNKEAQRSYLSELIKSVTGDDNGFHWGGKVLKYSNWYDDNIQATAIVLQALLADASTASENKDVIEKTVRWLMAQKKGSYWGNTQQSAFVVYALTDYLKFTGELNPDYTLKIYVNGTEAGTKQVTQEDVFRKETVFNAGAKFLKHGTNKIRVEKSGAGKSYLTASMVYYSTDRNIQGNDDGFEINRQYFKLERFYDKKGEKYVYRKKSFDGNMSPGEVMLVKVKVTPFNNSNEYFMLEDPIPAGCEVLKDEWQYPIDKEPAFNGTESKSWQWWYSEKEVLDNRIVFFASYMNKQEYEFSYLLRAETPGTYYIMPTSGGLMYYPDIYGNGKQTKLIIGQ